jgi:hypothetical protein
MATTRIYKNTGSKALSIVGIGDVKPGEQLSVTTDYHPPVVLANYPGLVEVTDESGGEVPAEEPTAPEEVAAVAEEENNG